MNKLRISFFKDVFVCSDSHNETQPSSPILFIPWKIAILKNTGIWGQKQFKKLPHPNQFPSKILILSSKLQDFLQRMQIVDMMLPKNVDNNYPIKKKKYLISKPIFRIFMVLIFLKFSKIEQAASSILFHPEKYFQQLTNGKQIVLKKTQV